MISVVVSIIHGFIIRRDYLTRLEFKLVYEAERERTLAAEYGVILESKDANPLQQSVQPVIHTQRNHTQQREKKITTTSPSSLLNINTASEDELADLPGVGIILAKKAVNHRQRNGNFEKLNDFFVLLELKDYEFDRLLPLIIISSPYTVR
ncbi:Helix-hairpin-helix motif protein [compost metagenome]